MIVCVCHAVSHRKILNVIQDGATTVEEVTRCCGAGGDCGACKPLIAKLLAESNDLTTRASSTCAPSPAPVDAAA